MVFFHRLGSVRRHVGKHAGDVVIGGNVVNMLAPALSTHQTGGPQQSQMVACQRGRDFKLLGNITGRHRSMQAGIHDPEPGRVAENPEQVGDLAPGIQIRGRFVRSRYQVSSLHDKQLNNC